MIPLERTAAVILAAGQSRRFGVPSKLSAMLDGLPLAARPARMLAGLPVLGKFAVIDARDRDPALIQLFGAEGFTLVENPFPEKGLDLSIRLGMARALQLRPDGILLCLADMPNISGDHVRALAILAGSGHAAISSTGHWRSPPVLIPSAMVERVLVSPGTPVRQLIDPAVELAASPIQLADVDTPGDLDALEAASNAPVPVTGAALG